MQVKQEIISQCLKGERKAQFELYRELYERYLGLCIRYRGDKDSATTSFNQAFVRILKNLNQLKDHIAFEAWAKQILVNQMLNDLKKEKIETERSVSLEDGESQDQLSVKNQGSEKLHADDLKRMLLELPKTTRNVFNLFAIDGFAHSEIAEMLGMSVGTSKWHVSEARTRLKKIIQLHSTNLKTTMTT